MSSMKVNVKVGKNDMSAIISTIKAGGTLYGAGQTYGDQYNFSGKAAHRGSGDSTGQLPSSIASEFMTQCEAGEIRYILYSYSTPIAWLKDDGTWVRPDVKYSSSTTAHQSFAWSIAHAWEMGA